jgi:hypothetical protein
MALPLLLLSSAIVAIIIIITHYPLRNCHTSIQSHDTHEALT